MFPHALQFCVKCPDAAWALVKAAYRAKKAARLYTVSMFCVVATCLWATWLAVSVVTGTATTWSLSCLRGSSACLSQPHVQRRHRHTRMLPQLPQPQPQPQPSLTSMLRLLPEPDRPLAANVVVRHAKGKIHLNLRSAMAIRQLPPSFQPHTREGRRQLLHTQRPFARKLISDKLWFVLRIPYLMSRKTPHALQGRHPPTYPGAHSVAYLRQALVRPSYPVPDQLLGRLMHSKVVIHQCALEQPLLRIISMLRLCARFCRENPEHKRCNLAWLAMGIGPLHVRQPCISNRTEEETRMFGL